MSTFSGRFRTLLLGRFRGARPRGVGGFDPRGDDAFHLVVHRHGAHQRGQFTAANESGANDSLIEIPILLTPRRTFRQNEVVNIETKPDRAARVRVADANKALFPPCGKNGGLG